MKKYLIMLVCLMFLLFGCSEKKDYVAENDDKSEMTTEKKHEKPIPNKIVTFSPAVVDFIEYYNINVDIISTKSNLPNNLKSRVEDYIDENISESEIEKIKEFNPDYIIVTEKEKEIIQKLSKIARVIELSDLKQNYYDGIKNDMLMLGNIFNNIKKVKYDIMLMEEKRTLLFEKGDEYNFYINLDEFYIRMGINNTNDEKDKSKEKYKTDDNIGEDKQDNTSLENENLYKESKDKNLYEYEIYKKGRKTIEVKDNDEIYGSGVSYIKRVDKCIQEIEKEIQNGKRKNIGN